MNKHICVHEAFDWIQMGEGNSKLTEGEYDSLVKYLNQRKDIKKQYIEFGHKKLRFINYVGILSIGSLTVEILPKVSLSNDKDLDKKILLKMLSKSTDIDLNLDEAISLKIHNYNLLELLANKYIDSLVTELNKGIHFEYIIIEENLNVIKGKLLLNKHIKHNHANKVKAYCSYSEYSPDNLLNQILKLACIKILNKVYSVKINNKTKKALFDLGNVSFENVPKETLSRFELGRQNKRYSYCLELAKFIILNLSNESTLGSSNGFSMLFEMNLLYEKYIGRLVKQIWSGVGKKVTTQDDSKYLLLNTKTNRYNFNLIPDIVLKQGGIPELIIDTKWKAVEYGGKTSYQESDIYQMYSYITTYKEARRIILLYPSLAQGKEYPKWSLLSDKNKFIEVKTVRLDDYENTKEDLINIIFQV